MIRFAVILFFFFHLALLLKARRFAWIGHLTGWGTFAVFAFLYISGIEENSDLTFLILAVLTGLAMIGAEFAARALKKPDA